MDRKRILLVDDSATVLMMERMALGRTYDLETAANGREAVEKATSSVPDLILLDIRMPEMDGLQALRELRSDERTRHVPVIMVTTKGEQESVDLAFEIGCSDYVTKPMNAPELTAKIRGLLAVATPLDVH